jgi:mono/diheme cytochrome c family protein
MKLRFWLAAGGLVLVPLAVLAASPQAGSPKAQPEPGEIPESAKALRNPVQRTEDVARAGRALWREHCETCHGTGGRGDGPSARLHELRKNVAPRDLTDPEVQAMADGEIFWRVTNGFIDGDNIIMPAYRNKVPLENQRWQLVLYVRELGRAAARK